MIKEKNPTSKISRDRWLVSYSDFVTLLFAFFVVMYAISAVNEGKFRVLSESLEEVFQDPLRSIDPVQLGTISKFLSNVKSDADDLPVNQTINKPDAINEFSEEIPLEILVKEVEEKFKGLINDGRVLLRDEQDWLEIQISSNLLFTTGGSFLTEEASNLIKNLSNILNNFSNPITVEGFTDNIPIANDLYPSNWELSSDRATRIVRELVENGINRSRLAAMGYGLNFPIADNDSEEGRMQNRRVILLIEKKNKRRAYLESISAIENDILNVDYKKEVGVSTIFEPQEEIIIERNKPEGNKIKGIRLPDGTLKFNTWGIQKDGE